jgi:predicted enzyme related to lactoylglutathione lyase
VSAIPSVVLFVHDVERVTAFYRALFRMERVAGDADHTVLELPGFQLVRAHEDSYLKICLPVASIETARAEAATLGGGLLPADREWTARGFRACDGHDPEGNIVQVRESIG